MQARSVTEEDLRRLKQEREAADRRYNEALSELDAAVQRIPDFPHPPPAPDETQVTPLNTSWEILSARPAFASGWRGRLAAFVWRLLEPSLAQQQTFNAALVDHVNRNVPPQREVAKSIESTLALVRAQLEQLVQFQSRLILYLQQITPYVDTKDYEFRGLDQRIVEDVAEAQAKADKVQAEWALTVRGLAGALRAVSDDSLKRWERHEVRYDGMRMSLGALQRAVHAVTRELEHASSPRTTTAIPMQDVGRAATPVPDATLSHTLSGSRLQSHKYLAFEDAFRGDPGLITARQREYVTLFAGCNDVLDIGCGRGEFLRLLKDSGVTARGIDFNYAMVTHCIEAGLDAAEADALDYLRTLPDGALGGLIAAQVVEHLQPDYLLQLLDEAYRVLRPNSPIVLETINVTSWYAFFSSYLRDLTHVRPLHPDTLHFFVLAAGFLDAEVRLISPMAEEAKLLPAPPTARDLDLQAAGPVGGAVLHLADYFDLNVKLLNRQLYGPQDYAVVAWKR
jgi:SAM-dependent methyltransferase